MAASMRNETSESLSSAEHLSSSFSLEDTSINISRHVTFHNISTTQATVIKNLSWCHDLQGSDFIYTPTLYSQSVRHVIAVAFILVMAVTVLGNAIVIIIVVTDRPLRRITSALVS